MARKIARPRAEVIEHFHRRRAALLASCEGFDQGKEFEVERIATEVFTFVYDGGRIVSILSRLGIRSSARFVSSNHVEPDSKNLLADTPLILTHFSSADKIAKYLPRKDNGPKPAQLVKFSRWWEKELIYKNGSYSLTRKRLVFSLRHQDGGGHVGTLTDESYKRLKNDAMFVAKFGNDPEVAVTGALGGTMRQIGWELEQTLASLGEIE